MNLSSNSAVLEFDSTSELNSNTPAYNGPVCSQCSAPDEGYAICRVCGYYPKLGSYVEVDYEMEGLVSSVEEEKPAGFQMPIWANTAIAINLVIIAECILVAVLLPDSSQRMVWSLLHFIGGGMILLSFQFRGTVWAMMDDTSVTFVDCLVWPPRAWEAVAARLPKSSRHFTGATVGAVAMLMSLLVLRGLPELAPAAVEDDSPKPKPKSIVAQVLRMARPKAGKPGESMEEALSSFVEEAGAMDAAAGDGTAFADEDENFIPDAEENPTAEVAEDSVADAKKKTNNEAKKKTKPEKNVLSKAAAEMKAALDQTIPEEQLRGKEKILHTARSIVIGYIASDTNPDEISSIVVATASRFNNSRSKFEILGSVSVQGTPQAERLMNELRATECTQPFVESHLPAVWVEPKLRCEIDFNEFGANRQPVNLKLKSLF